MQQGVGAFGGGGGELALARVEPRLAEQFDHAEDAGERRADLVAHVREKFALGLVGAVGLLGGGVRLGGGGLELEVDFFQ